MAITDYNYAKNLEVPSVSGTPTISRAVPIKVTSGDGTETGTGEIAIDWTNVSSQGDIGVFDENNNLLDYHFESFDATNETAVVWVYRDWVRDGSTQAKIAYGNGPSDQSVAASTVFDKEANLQAGYLFNESSGDLLDVTSNNNDGTVTGATQGADGVVGGAYSFDGADDYVDIADHNSFSAFTLMGWTKPNSLDGSERHLIRFRKNNDIALTTEASGEMGIMHADDGTLLQASASTGVWHHLVGSWDGSTVKLFLDGVQKDSKLDSSNTGAEANSDWIGGHSGNKEFWDGDIDNLFIYDSALNSDEISALYAATKSTPDFFSQQAAAVVVTTDPPTNVTNDSATLNGTLEDLQGNSSLDVYFEYGTDTSYGTTTATQTISSVPTSFDADISGLTGLETYHYRSVATDGTNYWYGGDISFYAADLQDVDETQSEFQNGTLTNVEADSGDYLRLADTDVLDFNDANSEYVDCNAALDGGSSLTVECWIKIHERHSIDQDIFSTQSADNGWALRLADNVDENEWGFTLKDGSGGTTSLSAPATTGSYVHLAAVWDGSTIYLYEDGSQVDSASISTHNQAVNNANIGRTQAYGNYVDGNILDCRLWNTARTQTEIQDNMNKRLNGDETGLVAYYKLDEGTGTTATDSAGSNDGSISGASWVSNEPLYFNNSSDDNNRTHQVDLSSLSTYDDSLIEWTETLNSQTITVETRLSLDGGSTWDSWQTATSGSEIPNFSGSEDLSNALLECRQNLSTSDSTSTPELHTLNIAIAETTAAVLTAQAVLAGQGDLTATTSVIQFLTAQATLEGQGDLSADAVLARQAVADLAGKGSLTATTSIAKLIEAQATLQGQGNLTVLANVPGLVSAQAMLQGQGNLNVGTTIITPTVVTQTELQGKGDLTAVATPLRQTQVVLQGQGNLTVVAEVQEGTVQFFMFEF